MDKLKMHTPNMVDENIEKIGELFPGAITERKNNKGETELIIDFEVLRQELSNVVVEGKEERYQFTWPDKRKSVLLANAPIAAALRPNREESVNFDTTENLYIEGDNLDVLKLLRETYLNRVKMIYIDPPYNTGNDFVYEDDFAEDAREFLNRDGQYDEQGNRLAANLDSNGRFHTDWLNMMYPRLRVARDLLTDDGVIFISIDDNEVSNLTKICDEIFGSGNYLGTILWKKKTNGNNMGVIPPVHDYILSYAKSASNVGEIGYSRTQEHIDKTYSNPDNDERGPWTTMDLSANHKGPHFPITNPKNGEIFYPPEGRYWVFNEKDVLQRIKEGRIIFGKSGNVRPVQKVFAAERLNGKIRAESWWDNHGMNEDATTEIREMFGAGKLFTHPKPSKLLYNIFKIASSDEDLVLDFFSGSASTAHAVIQLNAEDGGNRKFILVQLPEETDVKSEAYGEGYKNICEIGKERIRRAGAKIKEEAGLLTQDLDTGFRVLKLDSSNMKDVYYTPDEYAQLGFTLDGFADNIKEDRTDEDLLFQVMLELGIPLSARIRQDGNVFTVDDNLLVACFKQVDTELITEIAQRKPFYAVFRDSSFINDSAMVNFEQVFNTYSPTTIKRVL